jgi:aminoglycoside phosphotransferase (APT) family kinase protein
MPVALIDWDSARPGGRVWELAYMAWTCAIDVSGPYSVHGQAQYLRDMRDGYVTRIDLVGAIMRRQKAMAAISRALLQQPDRPEALRASAARGCLVGIE